MKASIFCLLALTVTSCYAGRTLKQPLPVLPALPALIFADQAAPVPAPAPAPGLPTACALEYLVNAGNYNTLIELVEGASGAAEIAQVLDSPTSTVTLLAPTDAGIAKALPALGLTPEAVLADPVKLTDILLYHVLPSQIQSSDLVDGYAFNTQLVVGGSAKSVSVQGSGGSATIVGGSSSAPVSGGFNSACNINILPIDGLLVP